MSYSVMAVLVPAIHAFTLVALQDVDVRQRRQVSAVCTSLAGAGHDELTE
jgi:hypothetical protein